MHNAEVTVAYSTVGTSISNLGRVMVHASALLLLLLQAYRFNKLRNQQGYKVHAA